MALPSTITPKKFIPTGIEWQIQLADTAHRTRVQRAPDVSGSPGTYQDIAVLPEGQAILRDLRLLGSKWWYRCRHEADDEAVSAWTTDFCAVAVVLDEQGEIPTLYKDEGRRRLDTLYDSDTRLLANVIHDITADVLTSNATESGTSPNITVKRSATFDGQTRRCRVYRRTGNWPTTDATQSGPIDEQYFKTELNTRFQVDYSDDSYATSNVVYDIWVPVNVDGDRGTRHEASYTVTGTASPQITGAWRSNTQSGTSCTTGSRRKVKLDWTTSGASDANQDMKIYERVNGGSWSLVQTEVNPVSVTTYTRETAYYEDFGGALTQIDYKLELITSPSTIEDTAQLDEDTIFVGTFCP